MDIKLDPKFCPPKIKKPQRMIDISRYRKSFKNKPTQKMHTTTPTIHTNPNNRKSRGVVKIQR